MGENIISQKFCLNDFLTISDDQLHKMVFVHISTPDSLNLDEKLIMQTTFYQVTHQKILLNGKDYHIIKLKNVSTTIRYQRLIGEKRLLEQINALVSHEMRNPLNAILSMVAKIKLHAQNMKKNLCKADSEISIH